MKGGIEKTLVHQSILSSSVSHIPFAIIHLFPLAFTNIFSILLFRFLKYHFNARASGAVFNIKLQFNYGNLHKHLQIIGR